MDEILNISENYSPTLRQNMVLTPGVSRVNGFERVQELVKQIKECCTNVVVNYIKIGFYLKEIKENRYYERVFNPAGGIFQNIESFALSIFGFGRTTTYNMLGIVEEFCDAGTQTLKDWYKDYSYTQLREMLPLPYERYKLIEPSASSREIRELRQYWDEYGFDEKETWKEALQRGRERAAAETQKKRDEAKTKNSKGLLSLLSGDNSEASMSAVAVLPAMVENPIRIIDNPAVVFKDKLSFKNDKDITEFLSFENCKKWPLYISVEALGINFHRYCFRNGAYIIAEYFFDFSHRPCESRELSEYYHLHLINDEYQNYGHSGFLIEDIIDYMKKHKDEI